MSNTLFIGKVYHRFDELPSTNDWAAKLLAPSSASPLHLGGQGGAAKTKPPEGTVVRAANQTAGRGQLGSRWHSLPGENLLLSVIFYPNWLEAQAQFYLSMTVALALRDIIAKNQWPEDDGLWGGVQEKPAHFQPLPTLLKIKWPNDLYLGGKKAAGVLIQNALLGSYLQSAIVGIGLNVNQLEFPTDLPNATSMARSFGQKFDLDALAERLFECLERRYLQLKAGNWAAIKAEYEECLWLRGRISRFVRLADGSEFEGTILGVTERGLLRVKTNLGVEEFEAKQLRFVV